MNATIKMTHKFNGTCIATGEENKFKGVKCALLSELRRNMMGYDVNVIISYADFIARMGDEDQFAETALYLNESSGYEIPPGFVVLEASLTEELTII